MTNDETAEVTGPLAELALITVTGHGKITWPDGTEVSADQFQNSVTAAVTAYAKGLAAGRRAAQLEAVAMLEDLRDDSEDEPTEGDPDNTYGKGRHATAARALFWIREMQEAPTTDETPCPCVSPDVVEWQAQRLWRAVGPDGDLWAEASDEAEVRERARAGDTIQQFYVTEPRGEWRNA